MTPRRSRTPRARRYPARRRWRLEKLESRTVLHSELLVTEIMYHAPDASSIELTSIPTATSQDFDFMEVFNAGDDLATLTGIRIVGDIQLSFSSETLAPGERAVIVANEAAFASRYGNLRIVGQWAGTLPNDDVELAFVDSDAHELLSVHVAGDQHWPARADGLGSSLELHADAYIHSERWDQPSSWLASRLWGGTPAAEAGLGYPLVINELAAGLDAQGQRTDTIELWNSADEPIDVSGWWLFDGNDPGHHYGFPEATIVGPQAYLVIDHHQLDPSPDAYDVTDLHLAWDDPSRLILAIPTLDGAIDTFVDEVRYAPTDEFTWGRPSGHMEAFVPLANATWGTANSTFAASPLVLSEIEFAPTPPREEDLAIAPLLTTNDLKFVELHNTSDVLIHLPSWQLTGDIRWRFPLSATPLSPDDTIVVVGFDPLDVANADLVNAFRHHHAIAADAKVMIVGPWEQVLPDSYGDVTLEEMIAPEVQPERWVERDRVPYATIPPWPLGTAAQGGSLTRIDPQALGAVGRSWVAAAPSPGVALYVVPSRELLPDLTSWDDPLLGFNHVELIDTHRVTGHRLLRFATAAANIGEGPLRIEGREITEESQRVVQVVQRADGSTVEYDAGEYVFHPTHHHVHFANYAEYNLRTIDIDGGVGPIAASSNKISFCLVDFAPYDLTLPGATPTWIYSECDRQEQGISVGWADIYGSELDDQWIDIENIAPGEYWLETVFDPQNRLLESNENNNVVRTRVVIGAPTYLPDLYDEQFIDDPHLGTGDKHLEHLSLHQPGDVDRFRWTSPGDGQLRVQLQLHGLLGDADLYVWGNGTTHAIDLHSAATDGSSEALTIDVTAGASYFVVVKDLTGQTMSDYELILDGPDIGPDRFEVNDGLTESTTIATGEQTVADLSIDHSNDIDSFVWTADRTGRTIFDVRHALAEGALVLHLYDNQYQLIATSTRANGRDSIEADVHAGTVYYLQASMESNAMSSNYSLHIENLDTPPDRFEPNNSELTPVRIGPNDQSLTQLSIHRPFERDVFVWRSSASGIATVDLNFQVAAGNLQLILWDDGEEVQFGERQAAGDRLTFTAIGARDYLIEVRGQNGATNSRYDLNIDAPEPPQIVHAEIGPIAGQLHAALIPTQVDGPLTIVWPELLRWDVAFNHQVLVAVDHLILTSDTGAVRLPSTVRYDSLTHRATWFFDEPWSDGHWTATLSDRLTDAFSNPLDGEAVGNQRFPSGNHQPGGTWTLSFTVRHGDLNSDGAADLADLLGFVEWLHHDDPQADLDTNGAWDSADLLLFVTTVLGSTIGDANLDHRFDSTDLVQIFQAGQFEDLIVGGSDWSTGDWTGDGEFDTADLVFAFQQGDYRI